MRVLLLILVVIVLACGNDDEVKNDLIGSWVAVNIQRSNCTSDNDNGDLVLECTDENCERYIFSDSSTFLLEITEMGATITESGTLSISGDRMTLCDEDEEELICVEFTFAVSGSTLFLTGSEEDSGCTTRTEYNREG